MIWLGMFAWVEVSDDDSGEKGMPLQLCYHRRRRSARLRGNGGGRIIYSEWAVYHLLPEEL